ncbi:MAG: hypothetical protein JJE04_08925 [Acidobacteriia bacterium]|nr:hypothetical protein [Terriglobia bacterium]
MTGNEIPLDKVRRNPQDCAAGLRFAVCGLVLLMSGCGNYADFRLPALSQASRAAVVPRWQTDPEPVLGRGPAGAFDSVDALNPSVIVRNQTGVRIWWNLYSGFDGTAWHTGLARSIDGVLWEKLGKVLSPDPGSWEGRYIAANGSSLEVGKEIFYWYQAGEPPRVGLARSTDGRRWRKDAQPVLPLGPRGSWDERASADPYVVRYGEYLYMYYLGEDRARRQRLGVARSQDGVVWWKLRGNPVLELGDAAAFDEQGLGEPAVWASHGRYWMLYTGRDRVENRRLGLAWSADGVTWKRWSGNAVLAGDRPWNAKVVCDPTVEVEGGRIRVWFGGGDVAHPAENIHGQIGRATLFLDPVEKPAEKQ